MAPGPENQPLKSNPIHASKGWKSFLYLSLAVVLVLGGVVVYQLNRITISRQPNNHKPTVAKISSVLPSSSPSPVSVLSIPSIGVSAAVEAVGLTHDGDMDVPTKIADVGWFKMGPSPGQPGNAVVAGHLNTKSNQPAVFWDLHKLHAGDSLFVTDAKNKRQRFRVIEVANYDLRSAPLERIFGGAKAARLNLVTCAGDWDQVKNDYSRRLVVYTELWPES